MARHGQRTPPCHFNFPVSPLPFASAGRENRYPVSHSFFAGFQINRDAQSLPYHTTGEGQSEGACRSATGSCTPIYNTQYIIATTGTHPGAMSSACISRARPSHTDADTDNTPMDTTWFCSGMVCGVSLATCRRLYSLLRKTSRLIPRVVERLPPPTLLARAILSTLAAAAAAPTPYGPWPSPPLPPDDPAA